MSFVKTLSVIFFIGILIYTGIAVSKEGLNYLQTFITLITTLTWAGQFTFDFMLYLILSGLWIAWRHAFTAKGILLGVLAANIGMLFFAPYLFFAAAKAKDLPELMLGDRQTN